MPEGDRPSGLAPESRTITKRQTRISLVWIVPIVAALAGLWVAVTRILAEGPKITIVFDTAEGLEAGKTKVHYNGVEVGSVTGIRLSDDHQRVVATVDMVPKTEDMLVEDTHFWVVRPRISGANISGLGTLISGAYIGMEIGKSGTRKRDFVALTVPPIVAENVEGRFFALKTPELGSLDTGTPLYFRRLQVGKVVSYKLDADGHSLTVKAFVNAPYDRFVTPDTRFWQASGVDVSLSASGLSVQTQSLLSILIGGIAFETPEADAASQPAAADTVFNLFSDRTQAFKPPRGDPQTWLLVFNQSVRGLTRGAPVEFRGIPIGEVTDIRSHFDQAKAEFSVWVTVHVYPETFGGEAIEGTADPETRRKTIDAFLARGLRAQLRSGSLLTGAMFVAVDFFPDAAPVTVDWAQTPLRFPTTPGELEATEATLVRIVNKLDKIPLEKIGDEVSKALVELNLTLDSARRTLDTADKMIAPDAGLRVELADTLDEVGRAARAIRVLADYLERHPESLIRGKPGDK
jgi:paraquat-inducible protein B